VHKSQEPIQVKCTKDGFADATGSIPANFQGWTIGNAILGGVIGVVVDAESGAMHEYPNAYEVPMHALPNAAAVPAPASDGKPTS
jgi:hypothetical protein